MNRLLFFVLMTVCSVSVAEWRITTAADSGGVSKTFYHDKSTIRRNGVLVKMWTMTDFSEVITNAIGKRIQSQKILWMFNCKDESKAIISFAEYSGSLGEGNVEFSNTVIEKEWKWVPITPESVGELQWQIACSKK